MQHKMKKPKKDKDKDQRQKAFMSFLEAPTTTTSDSVLLQTEKKNASDAQDYQEFVEDTNQCYICFDKLDPIKKKKCGFCQMQTCNNHMRKRRRLNKKFERICDNCEDKYLYESYMKLQLKAQQALATQQQIVSLKHEQFLSEVETRRIKWKDLNFKTDHLNQKHVQNLKSLQKDEDAIAIKQHQLQKKTLQNKQLELFVQRASSSIKQNYEQDYRILLIQNQKLSKDLVNLDKRRGQVQRAIEKRQKQIESAYQEWQKRQYMKNEKQKVQRQQQKKKDCVIY